MKTLRRLNFLIPLLGVTASCVLLVFGKLQIALGSTAGTILVTVDWFMTKFLWEKIADDKKENSGSTKKYMLLFIIGIKFLLIAILFYISIIILKFDARGMAIGVGALPTAVIIASAFPTKNGEEKKENS